jgi:hypothetical protein
MLDRWTPFELAGLFSWSSLVCGAICFVSLWLLFVERACGFSCCYTFGVVCGVVVLVFAQFSVN